MASKKSLLKKRKQAQKRRTYLNKIKVPKIENRYLMVNKKGNLVYTQDYYKSLKNNKSVEKEKEWLEHYRNEYNKMYNKYNKEEKKELVELVNRHQHSIRKVKEQQIKNKQLKQAIKQGKLINTTSSSDDIIILNRVNGATNFHNTVKVDEYLKSIAKIVNTSFDVIRDLIFPTYEEDSTYNDLQNLKEDSHTNFKEFINDLLNKKEIDKEQYNTLIQLEYQATHQ